MKKLVIIAFAFSNIVYAPPARVPHKHLAEGDIDGNGDQYRKSDRHALHRQVICNNDVLRLTKSKKALEQAYKQVQAAIAAAIESQKENCEPEESIGLE